MEYMSLAMFIKYGTPFLLIALLIINVVHSVILRFISASIKDIKTGVVWQDEFKQIEKRVDRLEKKNNGLK